MNRCAVGLYLLIFSLLSGAPAQTQSIPQSTTLVAAPLIEMSWMVEIGSTIAKAKHKVPAIIKSEAFPPIGTLLKEENSQTGDLRKQTKVYSDGSLTRYAKGSMVLYFDPRTKDVIVEEASPEQVGGDLRATQFSELAWVKPALHTGSKTYEGIACDVYQRLLSVPVQEDGTEAESAPVPEGVSSSETVTAYIDQKTRLPVALVDPSTIRKYKFSPLATPVVLPSEFAEALQRVEAAIEQRRQRYNIPQ